LLKDGTDLAKYGAARIPEFAKIPVEFSNVSMLRPDHASLIAFIIQVQNAGHCIPRSFHPFFLKFMADSSLYDVDGLIAGILALTSEENCNYTNNPKYHFKNIQHFVDELNFLFQHYSDVPLESISQGTDDILARGARQLPDGSYPLQVFMASAAHKQLAVMRALQSPSNWSTASVVLNSAKAAIIVATEESLGKALDSYTRRTFFTVELQNRNAKFFTGGAIEDAWKHTPPGIRIEDMLSHLWRNDI